MAPPSLKRNIQSFKTTAQKLQVKLEQLRLKKEDIRSSAFTLVDESREDDRRLEEQETYQSDVSALVVTVTDTLIEILELKLEYVQEVLKKLMVLLRENRKIPTPPELMFSRYEDWVGSNQRLFELNSQLYDLEKLKFDIRKRQIQARNAIATGDQLTTGSQFIHSSVQRIQSFLTRFKFPVDATSTTQNYLHDLLSPRRDRTTIEAEKMQEYVSECIQHSGEETHGGRVRGAHPQHYHEFMTVLCGYIVEKQREWQGEEIPQELVYTTVERHLMPQIQQAVMKFVAHPEQDATLHRQCEKFANITLDQLSVKPQLQSSELVPFIDSIMQLRATYFSPNPTDKMYAIVAAAKALYDQLGMMGEMSIDGDSFLDLWVYIILKANIKDLATNFHFMAEYGNPQLAKDEAGYYLTTLEAAIAFIEDLSPDQLAQPTSSHEFVVCETERFSRLAELPSSCFKVVRKGVVMEGYQMAVIQEWALNRARIFTTALLPTGNTYDSVTISVIRLDSEHSSTTHVQYFAGCFTNPGRDLSGLYCGDTPLGRAVLVDSANCDPQNVILLPTGNFNRDYPMVEHVLQLIRLGCQGVERGYETCIIPPSPPDPVAPLMPPTQSGVEIMITDASSSLPRTQNYTEAIGHHNRTNKTLSSYSSSPYFLSLDSGTQLEGSVNEKEGATLNGSTTASVGTASGRHETSTRPAGAEPLVSALTVQVEVHDMEPLLEGATSDKETPSHPLSSNEPLHTTLQAMQLSDHSSSSRPASTATDIQANSNPRPSNLKTISVDSSYGFSSSIDDGSCPVHPHLANPQNILSREYAQELEANFVKGHLYGDRSLSLESALVETIRQGQMYLQRLNYLSLTYKIDGVYTDTTLQAVKTFQKSHNTHESKYTVVLPENGHLTAATFQYLRQAFLTIYASLLRLGLDQDLGQNFNPMSASDADIITFRDCVTKFQQQNLLQECQRGALGPNTIDKIRHVLRTKQHTT